MSNNDLKCGSCGCTHHPADYCYPAGIKIMTNYKSRIDDLEQRIDRLERLYEVMSEWNKPEKSDTITIDRKIAEFWYYVVITNCKTCSDERDMIDEVKRALEAEDGK